MKRTIQEHIQILYARLFERNEQVWWVHRLWCLPIGDELF